MDCRIEARMRAFVNELAREHQEDLQPLARWSI